MAYLGIRGQETTLQIIIDGDVKQGTFARVENFTLTPRTDLSDLDFLGEDTSTPDVQHHGYDFSFTVNEEDTQAMTFLMSLVQNEELGLPHQDVQINQIVRYRDPSLQTSQRILNDCVLKLDSTSFGGRKELVKNAFSGKCRTMDML